MCVFPHILYTRSRLVCARVRGDFFVWAPLLRQRMCVCARRVVVLCAWLSALAGCEPGSGRNSGHICVDLCVGVPSSGAQSSCRAPVGHLSSIQNHFVLCTHSLHVQRRLALRRMRRSAMCICCLCGLSAVGYMVRLSACLRLPAAADVGAVCLYVCVAAVCTDRVVARYCRAAHILRARDFNQNNLRKWHISVCIRRV